MNRVLSTKQVWLMMGLVALLVAAIFISLWMRPDMSANRTLQGQIADARKQLTQLQTSTQTAKPPTQEEVHSLLAALPDNPDQPQLLVTIENIASSSGVQINDVSFDSGMTSSGVGQTQNPTTRTSTQATQLPASGSVQGQTALTPESYTLNLTVRGTYNAVESFLTSLQNAPRYFSVAAVTLTPSSGPPATATEATQQAGPGYVEARIQMNVYDAPVLTGLKSFLSRNSAK